MSPDLTIITPVYNGADYIEGCIRNVLEQRCANIEHLIIDGGSTDETQRMVGELAMKNPNIIFLNEKGSSQSEAMNLGIQLANASVIGFLNVDDFYAPKTLKRVIKIFKNLKEPSLAVGNCNVLNSEDEITSVNKPDKLDITDLLAGRPYPYNPSAYFYHKSIHQEIGDYNPEEHYVMDLDFLLRAVQASSVHYFDELWGNFRVIEGTKTFSDSQNGNMFERTDALRDKYRAKVSILAKLIASTKRFKDKVQTRYFS